MMPITATRLLRLQPILVITLIACIPALFSGYLGDDYIHHALLSPDIAIPKANDWSLFGLFSWIDAEPARNQVLMDLGVIPWWTDEGMRYQFWRPVSEISHWIDHQLWRGFPAMMHLHSLLWYLGLGYLVFRLFRQMGMSAQPALIGLAVFMLDATHGLTISWIANRNALIAAVFGVLAIQQYVRWRETEAPRHFVASLGLLIASLFSGEIGISTSCYLGAYALILDRKGPWKGLLALWPFAVTCILWWTLYKLGNFGANNSDLNYIDPVESPLIFLSKLFERIPVLLFAQLGIIPAEIYGFSPKPVPAYLALTWLFIGGVVYLLWPLLRASAAARFWALGALFSVAPVTATVPADRNLLFVGIGASALLGMLFHALFCKLQTSRLQRGGTWVLVVLHLILSPLLLPVFSYSPQLWSQLMMLPLARDIPIESPQESLITFGIPMPIGLGATPMRFAEGLPLPDKFWMISSLQQDFMITRIDANTLRITAPDGMINAIEANLRNLERNPITTDFRIRLTDLDIAVSKVMPDGKPRELTLTFHNNRLENTRILTWNGMQFERHAIPLNHGEALALALNTRTDNAGQLMAASGAEQ
ncbi:MAG: hypothetical protein R3F38_14705 [Gammaproteobacteria bacterium]